jgi:hypothetical protein
MGLGPSLGGHQIGAVDRDAEIVASFGEEVGQFQVQRIADRGEQFRGGFLLPAFDLGQVPQADPGTAGDITQGTALTFSM